MTYIINTFLFFFFLQIVIYSIISMYPSFKHHNYFQLRMECDCCGTVEVFSLWPLWDTSGGHDSANPTREVNFKECGRDTRKSKSDLECITETFCFPPGRAPGTNGFVKGVTELHCGNCRGLTLLKQRRSKIPRWAFLKCCTASNQTCAYHFLHLCTFLFFFFLPIFVFPSLELAVMATLCVSDRRWWCRGWWWLSWQREAGAEEDVGRVRRWWEAGQLSTRWSCFRNRRRRPLTFSNLHSLTSFYDDPQNSAALP